MENEVVKPLNYPFADSALTDCRYAKTQLTYALGGPHSPESVLDCAQRAKDGIDRVIEALENFKAD